MDTDVAIIGAGFGGLCMAIQLQKAGIQSFSLFEKEPRLGGTWRDNTYPGAACDVPSHLYSFSFETKHDWSRKFAEQGEILGYLEHCADKYRVRERIRFGVAIESARFDEETGRWSLRTSTGEQVFARALVSACGQLNRPAVPDIPGRDRFQGRQFHSARWDGGYDPTGQRVALVGTGASAIQIVPRVAAQASRLTVFQRTPPWILLKPDRAYARWEQALLARLPWLQRLHRWLIYWRFESRFLAFRKDSWLNRAAQRLALRHLEKCVADPRLRAALTPDYPAGCKRVLISDDYYQALGRDNVELVTQPIAEIVPDGVITGAGVHHAVDAIVYGTGFQSTDFLAPMRIVGRDGRELNQAWREGAEAFLGISVPGFPNLFILYGPNTNLAHNSIIFMLEAQVRYVMGCLRALRDRGLRWMDLRAERLARYRDELRTRLPRVVWDAGCTSWYKTASGRNTNNWPGFTFEYWRRTRAVALADYEQRS
jgi:cation diffusion facilitator CzcD-associated flavoprotein CzcO